MSQNNITLISQFQQKSTDAAVTLDSVKAAINAWRETKKSASEKMPTILWDQILALLETAPESRTLAALNVTRPQLVGERRRRQSQSGLSTKDDSTAHVEPIDFCEVKQRKPEPSTGGLVYKYCMMAQGFGCVIRDYQRGSLSNGLLIQTASSRLNQGN